MAGLTPPPPATLPSGFRSRPLLWDQRLLLELGINVLPIYLMLGSRPLHALGSTPLLLELGINVLPHIYLRLGSRPLLWDQPPAS